MVRDELSVLSAFLAVAESPRDLLNHRCITFPHGSDGVYRWDRF
jgi:hypothetical protein